MSTLVAYGFPLAMIIAGVLAIAFGGIALLASVLSGPGPFSQRAEPADYWIASAIAVFGLVLFTAGVRMVP